MFCVLYAITGISDILDGFIARQTGTESETGAKLDTAADMAFTIACMFKLIPLLNLPARIISWVCLIAFIKLFNIVYSFLKTKEIVSIHSALNKATGLLLFFLLPLAAWTNSLHICEIACFTATVAALNESIQVVFHR